MSTRNPMNERYTVEEKVQGKTRKSASSAKLVSRTATVVDPPEKTKKQKKAEQRERDAKMAEKRGSVPYGEVEQTDAYKRLRRIWWGVLIGAVVFTIVSWYMGTRESLVGYSFVPLVAAYVLIIFAFYLDFAKIRKLRNNYNAGRLGSKSKSARAAQKKHAAEVREQKKAEAARAASGEVEEKKGFFAKLFKGNK